MIPEIIIDFLSAQQAGPFVEGPVTVENTVFMFAFIGMLIAFHKIINVPIVCMLGGFLAGAIALLETNVYFFPFTNLLVIVVAIYVTLDGFNNARG